MPAQTLSDRPAPRPEGASPGFRRRCTSCSISSRRNWPGACSRVVDRAPRGFLRAARVPGRQRLGLAVTTHLFPRLEADQYGPGRLTKIRARPSRAGLPRGRRAPGGARAVAHGGSRDRRRSSVEALISTERVLASVIEAVIGACYLTFGYETTAGGGRGRVHRRDRARARALGGLQVGAAGTARPARRVVVYTVLDEQGPPHDRTFTVAARSWPDRAGQWGGRSKKDAEQHAARIALDASWADREPGRRACI